MRALVMALTLAALGAAHSGNAQNLVVTGQQLAPVGWAANGSAYATAMVDVDREFLNRTQAPPEFSPQSLSSQIEANLASRLEASLERQLQQAEQQTNMEVNAN